MLIHTVLFWLKKDLNSDQLTHFRTGLESLSKIGFAEAVYIGSPAATEARPVIDSSYDFCLTVILKDIAAHDAYQIDPWHLDFIATCKESWEKVKIYDAD